MTPATRPVSNHDNSCAGTSPVVPSVSRRGSHIEQGRGPCLCQAEGLILLCISQYEERGAGLMLGQRRRRWPNINPTLGRCPVRYGRCR